ncbi:hypothetical protein ANO11243_004140 [Dothideomycetidae sp. 11243]|nr:hypothetical protein ANO11243_004140 [fungal sp. No.11243]
MAPAPDREYQALAKRKQVERDGRIPIEWWLKERPPATLANVLDIPKTSGILTPAELHITETVDATALLEQLLSGTLKSADVVRAFCKRAAIAQQVTNCLTEIFFDNAISRAEELDALFVKTGRPVGPLHGLPISIKDTFRVKGFDATAGYSTFCFQPAATNSPLVDLLLKAGAVLYCKTNIPLTLMALDSHNNIFGRTLNPANRLLTPGGSSGGEGALLAMRGSILGVGTDVGGSIRIPAMCNGLYGVKPSHGRVPYANQSGGSLPGADHLSVRASAGPLAHSLRDCELFLHTVNNLKAWEHDPEVVPLPWTPFHTSRRPLRIGVVRTDGVTKPLPIIDHFLSETAARLEKHGAVEIIELDLSHILVKCASLINKIFSIDGAETIFDIMEETGEPLSPWLQTRLKRRKRVSHETVRDLQGARNKLQTELLQVWSSTGGFWSSPSAGPEDRLDALIAPVAPHPVPEVDRWNTASYTASFVLLDYAAATLPVRKVVESDLAGEIDATVKPLSGWDKYNRTLWTDVDRKVYLGSPLCLQVITPRLHEEQLLHVMSVLDSVLKGHSGTGVGKAAKL